MYLYKDKMILFFPREICHHIVSYIPNIETRMHFGIFHKIKKGNYENKLNTYIRKRGVHWNNHTRYFSIQNIEYDSHAINDFVDIVCKCVDENNICISIFIWKLKEINIWNTNKRNTYTRKTNIQIENDLLFDDTYYWCVKEINYNIS